ncbi:MAG TPA: hypothetical protein V6D20_20680 [Candidatus Obscuribacterales bacterium]
MGSCFFNPQFPVSLQRLLDLPVEAAAFRLNRSIIVDLAAPKRCLLVN